MKYMVMRCVEREMILCEDTTYTAFERAQQTMKEEFLEAFFDNGYTQEDFDNGVGQGDEWELEEWSAWLNGDCNYDWKIFEFPDQEPETEDKTASGEKVGTQTKPAPAKDKKNEQKLEEWMIKCSALASSTNGAINHIVDIREEIERTLEEHGIDWDEYWEFISEIEDGDDDTYGTCVAKMNVKAFDDFLRKHMKPEAK